MTSKRQPCALQDSMFFAKLRGLPKGVKWPVKLTSESTLHPGFAEVYCRCDNKKFFVSVDHLEIFPNQELEKTCLAGLKKKPATRMCFEADIEWAWAELHGNTAAPSKKICLGTGANEDKQVKTKTMKTRLSDGVKRERMKVKKTKIVRPVSSNETVEKEKTTTSCCPRKGYERPETMEDFKDDYSDTIEDDSSEMIKKETKNNRRVNVKSTETVEKEITTTPCYPRKGYERPETREDLKDDYSDTIEDNSSEKVIKRTKNTRPVNIKSIETVEKEKTTTSCCPRKGYERPETMEDLKDDYCDTIEDNSSEKVKTGTKNSYPVNIKSTEMVEKEKTTTPYYPRKGYERPETMEDLKDNYSDTIEDDSSEKVKKETKNVRPVDVNSTVTVEKENTTPCYPRKGYERPETMEDFKDDYSDTIEDDSSEMVKKETKNNRRVNVKSTETVEKEITTPCYPRKGYERPETMEDLKDDYSDTIEDDSSEKVKKETKNARSIKVNSTVTVEKEKTTPYNPRIGYKRPETMEDLKDDYSDTIEDDSSEKVKKGTKNARLVNVMSTETVEKEITTTPCYPRKGYERPETMEDLKDDYSDTIEDDSSKKVKRGTKNSRPVNIKSNETVEKEKTTPCYPRKGYKRLETREDLKDNYSDTIEDDSSEKVKKETKNVRPVAVNSTVTVEKENTTPCYPRKGYERPETMEDFKDDYSDTIEDDTSEMVKKETKNNRRVNVKSTETVEKEITTTPCYPRKGYERPETMEDLKDDYSDTIEDDSSEKVKKETKNARSVKVNSTVTVEKEKTTPCNPRIGYKRPETMEDLKDDYSDTIEDDSSEKVKKRTKNACLVNVMSTETVEKEITTTPCYPRKGYERPETMEDLKDDYSDTIEDDSSEKVKRGTKNNRWVKVNSNETVEKEKTTPCYPRKGYERLETMEDLNADSNDTTTIVPDSEGELSEIIDISLDMTEHLLDKDSDTEDSDNSLSEEMIAKNINNRNIYVKKVIKSTMTKNGTSKKTDRLYNSYHCCPYCKNDKMFSNFAQHVLRRHKTETEVQKLEQEKDLKRRSNLIAQLRCRADHEHNVSVELKGKGEILLGRRFTKGTFCLNEYGPCPRCLEWLKTTGFLRHLKNCPAKELCKESQSCLLIESGVLTGRFNKMASTVLLKETFSIMKQDDVGKVAQDDDLIVTIGNRWMEKLKGNEINRKYYTSSIMRLAARFLIELKKTKVLSLTGKDENTLSDFLRPQHFDLCISAAMTCANQNVEDLEDLGSPSNAIKLGYEIKRLASAKLGYAIRERDSEDKDDCRDFLQLLEMEWGTRVTKLARVILNERKFNEQKNLPLPEDIQKLKDYLNQNLEEVVLEPAYSCYRRACMLVEAKLVSYNRRRPGEIQQIKLRSYERRVIGTKPIDHAMMRDLTKWEKHLLDSQEVVEVRGKTGRGVPVLLPAETKRALQFITNPAVREKVGIRKENPYVFASANLGVIRAYDSLSTVASEGGLQIPGKITSTNLRKYCATISQVLDMSKNQLDWVCEHLGHTVDVHRSHYRARSDIIERVEVAKLLMIQDFGCTKKFVGKRLDDIQFEDVLYNKETSVSEPSAMAPLPEEPSVTIPLPEEDDENVMQGKARADVFNFLNESDEEDVLPDEAKPKNRRKLATSPVVRQKWTDGEEKELQKLFKKQFRWISVLSNAKEQVLLKAFQDSGSSVTMNESVRELSRSIIERIEKLPGNKTCCDCGAPDPKWLSTNLGVLICLECCGIHRNLGVHISRTQSLEIDQLGTSQLLLARVIGNDYFNEVLEAKLTEKDLKPKPDSPMKQREEFIKAKYVMHSFTIITGGDLQELQHDFQQAIQQRDIQTIIQVYAEGLDLMTILPDSPLEETALHLAIAQEDGSSLPIVDFIIQNSNLNSLSRQTLDGNSCLHLCAMLNKTECMKCVLRTKPDIAHLKNNDGHTALDIATENNFQICAELLKAAIAGKKDVFEHVNIEWNLMTDDGPEFSDDDLDVETRKPRSRPSSLVGVEYQVREGSPRDRSDSEIGGRPSKPRKHHLTHPVRFRNSLRTIPNMMNNSTNSRTSFASQPGVPRSPDPPLPPRGIKKPPVTLSHSQGPALGGGAYQGGPAGGIGNTNMKGSVGGSSGVIHQRHTSDPEQEISYMLHRRTPSEPPPRPQPLDSNRFTVNIPYSNKLGGSQPGLDISFDKPAIPPRPRALSGGEELKSNHDVPETPPPVPAPRKPKKLGYRRCEALFDCDADNEDELTFREGEIIILLREEEDAWWEGEIENQPHRRGLFPISFVKPLPDIMSELV